MIEAKETLTGGITSKQTLSGSTNVTTIKIQPELEDITITPTKEQQTFTHENSDAYDKVTVNPIPEEYIVPEGTLDIITNGYYQVLDYEGANVNVTFTPNLQDKSVTITENGTQTITADDGYDGLGSVEVVSEVKGEKYAPSFVRFASSIPTDLTYETANLYTDNMTDMSSMFANCSNLTGTLDLRHWNVSNVTTFKQMFNACSKLKGVNLSGWKTPSLTNCDYMFRNNYQLSGTLDLSGWDTSKLTTLYSVFESCGNVQILNLSGWDTSNITSTSNLFKWTYFEKLILDTQSVFKITGTDAFTSSSFTQGYTIIYVPDNMIDSYKADTYWGAFANQIKGMSEYTE